MMISAILLTIENEEERDAVKAIFDKYFDRMTYKAYEVLNNRQDAEDAAMNVILKITKNPSNYLDYESIEVLSMVICMVKNEAIDIYRRNTRDWSYVVYLDDIEQTFSGDEYNEVEKIAVSNENRELVREAIDELGEKYRSVMLFSYYHNMRNKDIAAAMGIDRSEVDTLLFRARKQVQKKLKKRGYDK